MTARATSATVHLVLQHNRCSTVRALRSPFDIGFDLVPSVGFSNLRSQGNCVSKSARPPVPQLPAHPNLILASLSKAARQQVLREGESVEIKSGEIIYEHDAPIRYIYFPTDSYVSLVTPNGAAESIEVGMIGNEGVVGLTVLLGVMTSPLVAIVQGPGTAIRLSLRRFLDAVEELPALRTTLNRYLFVLTSQMAQSAACNRSHLLDARLARWVLMTQDRAQKPSFRMTHQFLSYMLGVRRPGVTEAAGRLQGAGLLRYGKSDLTVLDRKGLKEVSCPCYSVLNALYRQHLDILREA